MTKILLIFLLSSSILADIKFQEPTIPAEQGKLYNTIVELRQKDPQAALNKFSELPEKYSPAFDFLRAVILIDQKLEKRALTFLKTALKKQPTFYQARLTYAQLLLKGNDYKNALPELLKVVQLGRADGSLWKSISVCHLELKNYSAAESCLTQAKIFLPNDSNLDKALLNCYLAQEQFEKVEKLAEKLLEESKDDKNLWRIYIQALVANGKNKQALNHQQLLVKLFEKNDHDIKLLADMYFNEEVYLKAAQLYLQVEGSLSGQSTIQAARSFTYANASEKVIGILKSVKQFSPAEKTEFYTLKGQAYLKLKKNKEALQSFLNALKFDSQNSYVQFYIAEIYEGEGNSQQALDFYSRASSNKDFFVNSKLRKARIYINLNQNDRALDEIIDVRKTHKSDTVENFYKYLIETQK